MWSYPRILVLSRMALLLQACHVCMLLRRVCCGVRMCSSCNSEEDEEVADTCDQHSNTATTTPYARVPRAYVCVHVHMSVYTRVALCACTSRSECTLLNRSGVTHACKFLHRWLDTCTCTCVLHACRSASRCCRCTHSSRSCKLMPSFPILSLAALHAACCSVLLVCCSSMHAHHTQHTRPSIYTTNTRQVRQDAGRHTHTARHNPIDTTKTPTACRVWTASACACRTHAKSTRVITTP